jgi:glutamate synthase domain-containing protein 3
VEPGDPVPEPGRRVAQNHRLGAALDSRLIPLAAAPLAGAGPVVIDHAVANTDRSVGAMLAGEIARRAGSAGLPDDSIHLRLRGCAGQSLAAFAPRGLTIELWGACNDYSGKGLSGGRLIVRPPAEARYLAEHNVIAGNTVLYGATSGEAFFRGLAGERFAVRNSGARAVVEGVGDHGCEYMTGGVVVVLGPTGRNFAAGMSGGTAYVLDPDGRLAGRCNPGTVGLEAPGGSDEPLLRDLIERHLDATASPVASRLLAAWPAPMAHFVKVMPDDLRRLLDRATDTASALPELEPIGA